MKSIRQDFLTEGYVTLKKILGPDIKDIITEVIYENFKDPLDLKGYNSFDLEDEQFHQKLLKLRNKAPTSFGEIYDNINLNARFRSSFYNEQLLDIFADTLGISKNLIFLNGVMLRFDAPLDQRNNLDWHQDSPYYRMSYPEFNAGVCWMAVTRNNEDNGTLIFIPQSHSHFIETETSIGDKLSSQQFRLQPSADELKKAKSLEQEFGDLTVLHMNIKHRSGINSSNKFRITMGCRFHDMSNSFNSGKEIYQFNRPMDII